MSLPVKAVVKLRPIDVAVVLVAVTYSFRGIISF